MAAAASSDRIIAPIVAATASYEAWAGDHINLIHSELDLKHRHMAEGPFPFLRATFYRWIALWQETCPELAGTSEVLAVGDLHIENFGTWRDREARLIWGINDLDEAFPMPYAIDLVRLATSTLLAIADDALSIGGNDACAAILDGYRSVIARGAGEPFVLEEAHPSLRSMALGEERHPARFWQKLSGLRPVRAPGSVRKLLKQELPPDAASLRIVHRIAGQGSLGRERYVALADCDGGMVAREAKAILPSAYVWAMKKRGARVYGGELEERMVRARDPFSNIGKGWILRRLGPHCSAIELKDFPKKRDELRILRAMGRETANAHLATAAAIPHIRRDLRSRGDRWLRDAARKMAAATLVEWKQWRKFMRRNGR